MKEMSFPVLARNRRSCRKFSGEHIPDEILEKIIADAAYAPSSWGGHPMEYIIIRDRNTLKKLASCKQMGAGPLAYGDAAIVPIIDRRNLELWVEDASVASTYLLLAAEHYGIGACWIHMKDRKGHTGMADEDIRDLLQIPEYYGILNVVSLGMKAEEKTARRIRPVIHHEKY